MLFKPYYKLTDIGYPEHKLAVVKSDDKIIPINSAKAVYESSAEFLVIEHSRTKEKMVVYAQDDRLYFEKLEDTK